MEWHHGWLLLGDLSMPLLLIVDPGREKEAVVRLARCS